MLTGLILAIFLGVIPAAIAKSKGRSFVAWWVYGAAILIVALPHSIILKPNQQALDENARAAGMKKCPNCAEWVQGTAKTCRYCNTEFAASSGHVVTGENELGQPALMRAQPLAPEWDSPNQSNGKRAILIAVGVMTGCICLLALTLAMGGVKNDSSSGDNKSSTPESSVATTSSSMTSQSPSPMEVPRSLLRLTGSGTKSTQSITVPNEWKLLWQYDCSGFANGQGNFQVFVYNSDGAPAGATGVNQLGTNGSDTEYYHQGGNIYLEINSECRWSINIVG